MAQTWCRLRACLRQFHTGTRLLKKKRTVKDYIPAVANEAVTTSATNNTASSADHVAESSSRIPLFAQQLSEHDKPEELFGMEYRHRTEDILSDIPEKWRSLEDLKQSLEKLEFDVQNLRALKEQVEKSGIGQRKEALLWGTPDPKHPSSHVPCGGCGALLHCNDSGIPGYIPQEKFKGLTTEELETTLCLRCHCLSHKDKVIDIEVDKLQYKQIVKRIRMEKALILMVIDVTDITNSIIPDYVNQIGKMSSIFILGNKVDLVPKDCDEYLSRMKDKIWEECLRANLNPRGNNIKDIRLISAKTGYGIEDLITKLISYWGMKGNVYLVGTTNSGKSTLFNRFLESDYCKSSCRDIVQRATVSRWPGTTLSLVKFPIVKLRPQMAFLRQKRLEEDYARQAMERNIQQTRLKKYGRSTNARLFGVVGMTDFRSEQTQEEEAEKFISTGQQFITYKTNKAPASETDLESSEGEEVIDHHLLLQRSQLLEKRRVLMDEYPESVWACDTPGLINNNQIINCLTPTELKVLLNRQMIRPRVFVMKPGDSMFVTGLARVDYLQGEKNTLFAVFANHFLPVHIMQQTEADEFYSDNVCTEELGLPLGDEDRLNRLPSLCGREFTVKTADKDHFHASADIQLSSVGWIALGGKNKEIHLRVYTPGGRGMCLRQPALLANLSTFMGQRKTGSKSYNVRKLKP